MLPSINLLYQLMLVINDKGAHMILTDARANDVILILMADIVSLIMKSRSI